MSGLLTEDEIAELMPSELVQHATPLPTQIVASDEYYPDPQNAQQREVEARSVQLQFAEYGYSCTLHPLQERDRERS